jgi:mannose-6-phosphate isomerase-like protein (cupin superfamily)
MNGFFPKARLAFLLILWIFPLSLNGNDQLFYLRFVPNLKAADDDLTAGTEGASYKPIFGKGDRNADRLNGVERFGELTVAPGGRSALVSYPREEQIYYVAEGSGNLHYDERTYPLKADDFLYLPIGVEHGVSNDSRNQIRILVMGYRIPEGVKVEPTSELQIANANDVELLVLGSHGPTTKYKLLMGTTASERDKLASASQMNSLFIMNFSPGGTNNPHSHAKEEEIYYVLRGYGAMVAGLDKHGNVSRHPVLKGDAFYFAAGTEVGFYSGSKEGEPHSLILAVRSRDPIAESYDFRKDL